MKPHPIRKMFNINCNSIDVINMFKSDQPMFSLLALNKYLRKPNIYNDILVVIWIFSECLTCLSTEEMFLFYFFLYLK